MATLRQGDTTTVTMELSQGLGGYSLKVGIYAQNGKPLFETYYPGDMIHMEDATHYSLILPYEVTKDFYGPTTLRLAIYSPDKEFVNAGENAMTLNWNAEPVTKKLE